jgi:hypothetical protein
MIFIMWLFMQDLVERLDFGYIVAKCRIFLGEIMFGCFVNLCKVEGFSLKSPGPTGGLLLSMRFF